MTALHGSSIACDALAHVRTRVWVMRIVCLRLVTTVPQERGVVRLVTTDTKTNVHFFGP